MSKKKPKKRNKQYQGADAASQPTVHRYTVEPKGPVSEWWQEKKKPVKVFSIAALILSFLGIIATGLISLILSVV